MKVLLIDNFHYRRGGAEVVYLNTADILRNHGHEVICFSQKWPENIPCAEEKYFPDGYSFNDKKLPNLVKSLCHYFYNSEASKQLERLIIDKKPDIAHLHLFWGGLSPSIYVTLKRYGIPIVHSVHDYRIVCPAYTFKNGRGKICEECEGKKFYKCIVNRCSKGSFLQSIIMTMEMYFRTIFFNPTKYINAFLFVSKFSMDKHVKYNKGLSSTINDVLYNFRNLDVLNYYVPGMDTFNGIYLYYGRLSYEKGLDTLIKAFENKPELKLFIVGKGPLENHLMSYCRNKNLSNIEFLGFKSGQELFDIVKQAKFVIVPSEWYENNPMTIIESYSLGTPVIGSAIGGIPELILEGKTGLLFESGNVNSLETVLDKAESIPRTKYFQMKEAVVEFANNNFDSESYYLRLISLYKSLMK